MAAYGQIISYAFTSAGRIPIPDAVITITRPNGQGESELIDVQMTDQSGKTRQVTVETPDIAGSQSPGTEHPFTSVNMKAEFPGYEQIVVEDVQVFPQTITVQDFQLIPLDQHPDNKTLTETFPIPPQNL